ncbi:DUF305 domain-containing protein [Gordonia sp. CPCC 205515]|uniref:DUF305 domain-containing protein n=1 Tax=Gordonia sp. CPCC 205515 TaxID=3140791 RepID=UPI003AF3A874
MTEPQEEPAVSPSTEVSTPPDTSRRTLLTALGAIIALLVGVGLGLLIATMLHSDDTAAAEDVPAADSVAVGFAQDMIRHHEQGVEMAGIELDRGTDPQVRSMAFDILTAQSNEIGQMQSWLTRWGYPLINPNPPMQWMGHDASDHGSASTDDHDHADHDMSAMPGMSMAPSSTPATADGEVPPMPGMATTSEMNRLRSLSGAAADTYFLQLMLRHHQGGIPMMEYAMDPANVSEDYVRNLATGMKQTQDKEIAIITQMLAARGAQPLPMN